MDNPIGDSFWGSLRRMITANLGTKIVSIVIAMVLWGIVLGSRNVEITKEVPLEIITPADIVPSNEIPDKIAFRLAGPKAFLRSILDRREEPIRVNLSGAKPTLVTYRFFSDNIRVPIGVKVLSINPTAILLKLEYLKRKEIPVRVELAGIVPEGFRVVRTEVKPEKVRVKGAESRVDSITEIPTSPIDISNLKASLDKEVPIDLSRFNLRVEGDLPKVHVEIEPISANFRIKNVDIRVISPYKVRLEEKSVTVLVRGLGRDIRNLDNTKVYGVVDLSGKGKGKYTEPVQIVLPKSVSVVRVIPSTVNIVVY